MIKLIVILCLVQLYSTDDNEKRLDEALTANYNRLIRPVKRNNDQMVVKFGIKLTQILDVDEKNQILTTNVWIKHIWKDIYLQWNPEEYGNITEVSIPSSDIWVPDIILFNSADQNYEITLMTRANIRYDGQVIWEPPAIYRSSCLMNLEFFPFDTQHCALKFGSWTYDGHQVDLIHLSQTVNETGHVENNEIPVGMDLLDFYQNHEWDLMSVPATRNVIPNQYNGELYPDLTFNITLRRKTLFYNVNLIIPCVSLSFLTVLVFYLPSECSEKICLCTLILMSLTVFILLLNDLIPPTSVVVPLIAKYLLFTVVLVCMSNLVSVIVLNVHYRSLSTHSMPYWYRKLFIHILPTVLFMKPPSDSSLSDSSYLKEFAIKFKKKHMSGDESVSDRSGDTAISFERRQRRRRVDSLVAKSQMCPSETKRRLYLDQMIAVDAVNSIGDNLRREDEKNRVSQEWRYTAQVIDRLFLAIFTVTFLVGTLWIILNAPSLYENKVPIDRQMSRRFKAMDQ